MGPTIYPDLQPTVEREVVISDEPITGVTSQGGAQPPVISDAVNNPAVPGGGGQALPSPPINAPLEALPGAAVPGGSGAANQPMTPRALEFPALPGSQMLPATPVSADVPGAGAANQRGTTAAISPTVYPIPSYATTPQAKPVTWLDATTSQPVTNDSKANRPMPKRLGGR